MTERPLDGQVRPGTTSFPGHWQVRPLRAIARPGSASFTDGDWIESPYITDDGIRLIQTGNIGVGEYRERGFRYVSEQTFRLLGCTEVLPGDVLICRLADPIGRACLAPDLGVRMITSVDVCILRPREEVDPRFLVYWLSSAPHLQSMEAIGRGGTRQRISRSQLGAIRVPVPPIPEQCAIADYLDHETARIDALVGKKRRLVELLGQRESARLSLDVLGGARSADSYRQDCQRGLEPAVALSGAVPPDWSVEQIRRSALSWTDGPFGSALKSSDYSDRGARVIRLGNVGRGRFLDDDRAYIPLDYFSTLREYEARPGDVIVAALGDTGHPLGRACVIPNDLGPAIVKADCFRLRLDPSRLDGHFLVWFLSSAVGSALVGLAARGATRSRINLSDVVSVHVPRPPLAQQQAIVRSVEARRGHVDKARRSIEMAVARLMERRQALITAAVTGQIHCGGEVESQAPRIEPAVQAL